MKRLRFILGFVLMVVVFSIGWSETAFASNDVRIPYYRDGVRQARVTFSYRQDRLHTRVRLMDNHQLGEVHITAVLYRDGVTVEPVTEPQDDGLSVTIFSGRSNTGIYVSGYYTLRIYLNGTRIAESDPVWAGAQLRTVRIPYYRNGVEIAEFRFQYQWNRLWVSIINRGYPHPFGEFNFVFFLYKDDTKTEFGDINALVRGVFTVHNNHPTPGVHTSGYHTLRVYSNGTLIAESDPVFVFAEEFEEYLTLNIPLWDSDEHRNPNPIAMPTNGEVQAFFENFHSRHWSTLRRNPFPYDWEIPQWTDTDEQLSQEFIQGFLEAAERDTFFQGMPFNIAYMEEILSQYRVYFAPQSSSRNATFSGFASAWRRTLFVGMGQGNNRDSRNWFAGVAVHEIGHALGLHEQLTHLFDEKLADRTGSIVSEWPWYRNSNFDRMLLDLIDPVYFWRAAFTSNSAYAALWNEHMYDFALFEEIQMARTVGTYLTADSLWYGTRRTCADTVQAFRRYVNINAPTIGRTRNFSNNRGEFRSLRLYDVDNHAEHVLRAIPTLMGAAHFYGYRLTESDRIIDEAQYVISQLADFGRQQNLSPVDAVLDRNLSIYMQSSDWNLPARPTPVAKFYADTVIDGVQLIIIETFKITTGFYHELIIIPALDLRIEIGDGVEIDIPFINLRIFTETFFGTTPVWDRADRTTTITGNHAVTDRLIEVIFTQDSPIAIINGRPFDIMQIALLHGTSGPFSRAGYSFSPIVYQYRQYVPLCFLANVFGISYNYCVYTGGFVFN